jgi:hypothetical protein
MRFLGAFLLYLGPLIVGVAGLALRNDQPFLGYPLLVIAGIWLAADSLNAARRPDGSRVRPPAPRFWRLLQPAFIAAWIACGVVLAVGLGISVVEGDWDKVILLVVCAVADAASWFGINGQSGRRSPT